MGRKNIVAAGPAKKAAVQVAYARGASEPVPLAVDSFGTVSDTNIAEAVREILDLRPGAITCNLDHYAETP